MIEYLPEPSVTADASFLDQRWARGFDGDAGQHGAGRVFHFSCDAAGLCGRRVRQHPQQRRRRQHPPCNLTHARSLSWPTEWRAKELRSANCNARANLQ